MKRLALVAALALSLAACGGASTKSIVLQPRNPIPGGVYLQISGPSDAADYVALSLQHGATGGLVTVPSTHGRKDCAQTIAMITYPVTVPSLRKLGGQKITFSVYGDSQVAPSLCQQLPSQFPDGFSVLGGDRRIDHMPSSGMEPTLHCAKPGVGCLASKPDDLVTRLTGAKDLARFDIAIFATPKKAATECGEGGTFVKRVIGLPGETVKEDAKGFIWIRGPGSKTWQKLDEPYVSAQARAIDTRQRDKQWNVPAGEYFTLGDNRSQSCDSRLWGSVPATNMIGQIGQIIRGGAVLKPAGVPG